MNDVVHYSRHLSFRMQMRRINTDLPRTIYLRATRRYFDISTETFVAVMRVMLHKKRRDVMIIYKKNDIGVTIITIHPLKKNQLHNRVSSKRWIEANKI